MAITGTTRWKWFHSPGILRALVIVIVLTVFLTQIRDKKYNGSNMLVSILEKTNYFKTKPKNQGSYELLLMESDKDTLLGPNIFHVNLTNTEVDSTTNGAAKFNEPSLKSRENPSVFCLPVIPKLESFPHTYGRSSISFEERLLNILQEKDGTFEQRMKEAGLKSGGRYNPTNCRSQYKVAIIVPFRQRKDHFKIFLRYMHPFLQRQQLDYIIILVEQFDSLPFNRGMLMNIGFNEAGLLQEHFHCFIFHDVDMLPENDRNLYSCPEQGKSRQMAFVLDRNDYEPMPAEYLGGVTALTAHDFLRVNGFSNVFWGWGGEDDDFYKRVRLQNISITRSFDDQPSLIDLARYGTIYHLEAKPNPDRHRLLNETTNRVKSDGLADLNYKRLSIEFKSLYTHIIVDLKKS